MKSKCLWQLLTHSWSSLHWQVRFILGEMVSFPLLSPLVRFLRIRCLSFPLYSAQWKSNYTISSIPKFIINAYNLMAFDFLYDSPVFLSQVSYSEERFQVFSQLTVTTPAGLLGDHLCVALWPPGHSWLRKAQSCDPGQSSFFYTFGIWNERAKDQLTLLLQRVDC